MVLAWCFEDEQTPAVMDVLDRLTQTGAVAPPLWPMEALNGLLSAERRRRIDADKRRVLAGFLRDLPVTLDVQMTEQAWTATIALAERFRLTVYDACYLEVAQRRRLPLATLDYALSVAADGLRIAVLGSVPA